MFMFRKFDQVFFLLSILFTKLAGCWLFYYCFSLCYHRCFFTLSFTFNTSISFTLSQSVKIISFYDPFCFIEFSFIDMCKCVNTKYNKWWIFLEAIFLKCVFFFYNGDDLILTCHSIYMYCKKAKVHV